MKISIRLLCLLCFLITYNKSNAQFQELDEVASAVEVYKTIDEVELKTWIFNPPKHKMEDRKPAIAFFFGGGWNGGTPAQFKEHCEYLAARGMVAMVVDYRVYSRHEVRANKCVADAKSAIRWIRQNAERLGIDTSKIVAAGGSAGGHLAASTAFLPDHDERSDDLQISSVPNALALFNPVLVLTSIEGKFNLEEARLKNLETRMGAPMDSMSPYNFIQKGAPPTLIFHGTEDQTVPFVTAEIFTKKMKSLGNQCQLVAYEGEKHGFFNYLRNSNGPFISTLQYLDAFLVKLNYLESIPKHKSY